MFRRGIMGRKQGITIPDAEFGIYILHINNKLYSLYDWDVRNNAKAVGVAVKNPNKNFVIDKNDIGKIIYWNNSDINGLNQISSVNAKNYFNGLYDTRILVSLGCNAPTQCYNKIFKNGLRGYMGSTGEFNLICNNLTLINSCLLKIGGAILNYSAGIDTAYWTSTLGSTSKKYPYVTYVRENGGNVAQNTTVSAFVRAFCEFPV